MFWIRSFESEGRGRKLMDPFTISWIWIRGLWMIRNWKWKDLITFPNASTISNITSTLSQTTAESHYGELYLVSHVSLYMDDVPLLLFTWINNYTKIIYDSLKTWHCWHLALVLRLYMDNVHLLLLATVIFIHMPNSVHVCLLKMAPGFNQQLVQNQVFVKQKIPFELGLFINTSFLFQIIFFCSILL